MTNPENFAPVESLGGNYSNTISCTNQLPQGWTSTLQSVGGNAPGESIIAQQSTLNPEKFFQGGADGPLGVINGQIAANNQSGGSRSIRRRKSKRSKKLRRSNKSRLSTRSKKSKSKVRSKVKKLLKKSQNKSFRKSLKKKSRKFKK
jgi:hypothetical protein